MELVESEKSNLVILDIMLVDCNGLDLLQDIRNKYYDLAVIIFTAYDTFKNDQRTIAVDYYVIKSSSLDELKLMIERVLETEIPNDAQNNESVEESHLC